MSKVGKKTTISRKDIVELLAEKEHRSNDAWVMREGRLQKATPKKAQLVEKSITVESESKVTKSYLHGPPNHTIVYTTLPELLEKRSQETPDEEAHVFWSLRDETRLQRESISFGVLSERSAILAGNFLEMGLEPGDRMAIMGDNCPDWIYVEYAALRIGVTLVRLHSDQVSAESVRHVVFHKQCRAMVVTPGQGNTVMKKVIKFIPGVKTVDELLDTLPNIRLMTMGDPGHNKRIKSIQELIVSTKKIEEVIKYQDGLDPHDMAVAYSTSDSINGFPKFVGITHFSLINNMLAMDDMKWEDSKARFFNDRPFTWIEAGVHNSVVLGISSVHMAAEVTQSSDHTKIVLGVMEEEQITVAMVMPKVIHRVLRDQAKELQMPSSVQCILCSGEPLPREVLRFCKDNFEATCIMYASLDTFVVSKRVMSTFIANEHPYRLKPLPHVEMKVTDDDDMIVPIGTPGRLWVRSTYLSKTYLNFEHPSKKQVEEEESQGMWFHTEDLAVIYEDGTVEMIGREKDVITRDDVTIYPYTYEEALRGHDKINDVYAFGVEDTEYGEEVGVCVTFRQGYRQDEEALHDFCEEIGLDPLPEYYVVLDEFPRTSNAKIDRVELDAIIEEKIDQDSDGDLEAEEVEDDNE